MTGAKYTKTVGIVSPDHGAETRHVGWTRAQLVPPLSLVGPQ